MSFDAGVINGAVTLDDSDFQKKLKGLEGDANDTFKKIASMAAAYLTLRGTLGFVNSAMAEFSKVEEGANKLKYAYSEVRASAFQTAKEIENTYNVAEQTAMNAIANIGDLLTGFGFDQQTALNFADQITKRGIDIASFKGLDQTETINRMTVALTGNVHALQSMGIVIRQDSEEFKAEYQRILETTDATEQQAKAQAILNEIMMQSKNAENDYLRPDAARTYAQELTDLGESMKRFRAEAGKQMVSLTQPAVVMMRELLDVFGKGDDAMKGLIARAATLSATFLVLAKSGAIAKLNEIPKIISAINLSAQTATTALGSVKVAASGLYAALGPLGVAMIAISAGYAASTYLNDKWRNSLQASINVSKEELDMLKEKSSQMENARREESASVQRLEELARYTRLNRDEQKEAEILVKKLAERYSNLGIEIDKATGKLKVNAEMMAKVNRQQLEEEVREQYNIVQKGIENATARMKGLHNELGDWLTNLGGGIGKVTGMNWLFGVDSLSNFDQRTIENLYGKNLEDQIAELEDMRNKFAAKNDEERVEKIEAVISALEDQLAAEKRLAELNDMLKNGNKGEDATEEEIEKIKAQSEAAREALSAVENIELKIQMNNADNAGKIALLRQQIDKLFSENASGKYGSVEEFLAGDRLNMDAQELTALGEILEKKEQIANLDKESNEEAAAYLKTLSNAYNSYQDLLENRREKRRTDRLNRRIDTLIESGDTSGALNIAREQLNSAKETALYLRGQYESEIDRAKQTGVLDSDNIRELRSMLESAFSDVDKWQSRIEAINKKDEKQERENIRTVGGWSAELLSAQILGANSAQAQTAKYTKQSAEHLRNIDEEMENYGAYGV